LGAETSDFSTVANNEDAETLPNGDGAKAWLDATKEKLKSAVESFMIVNIVSQGRDKRERQRIDCRRM
jgi:hypothetical protein